MGRWMVLFLLGFGLATGQVAVAQVAGQMQADVTPLSRALLIPEAMEILREEGLANGAELSQEMPRAGAGSLWQQALERLYDPARMTALFDREFAAALGEDAQTIAASVAFLSADPGRSAIRLELSARRAMLNDDIETAAAEAYGEMARKDPGRQALIEAFVSANDLIEANVMGALNANLAFLRGMSETGGEALAMSEADMLAQVWQAEADTRAEMVAWLYPFLAMAYQPMSDDDLATYIAFSQSSEGRRLNAAMFKAFGGMFDAISRDLGRAFGRSMQGDDI